MNHVIKGTVMPVLEVELEPGEKLVSETGELGWMTGNMGMRTAVGGLAGNETGARGMFGAVKRALAGGTLFMTEYSPTGQAGLVAFPAKLPGTIMERRLASGEELFLHRHGFLCGTESVRLEMAVQRRLGVGFLGGMGFVLQKVSGPGTAFIELSGEMTTYELDPGEVLLVHPGLIGMFESSVSYELTTVPGLRNKFFGGDGLFLVSLQGPGRVWLQSLTLANLAHAIAPYLPDDGDDGGGGAGGLGGLGSILQGGR